MSTSGRPVQTCDACSRPASYSAVITCLNCGDKFTLPICSGHMEDPGPILAWTHTCPSPLDFCISEVRQSINMLEVYFYCRCFMIFVDGALEEINHSKCCWDQPEHRQLWPYAMKYNHRYN